MNARINFLDNLRTLLIFLVVMLHSGLVYEHVLENSWIVVDSVKCNPIGLIRMYLDLFIMFSIFFISGYFIRYSAQSKKTGAYLLSKFKRILLPWLVAVLTLIPAYKFIFLYSRGMPQEEWFSYFHFFQRAGSDLSIYSNNPTQNWLWFLPVLFLFQVIYAGLSKLNLLKFTISVHTGVIALFIIGVVSSVVISSFGLTGWTHNKLIDFQNERLLIYFMSFMLGALCNKLKVFESEKNNRLYIIVNVVLTLALSIFTAFALNLFFNIITPDRNHFFISEMADRIVYYSTAILSMLSFLYILIHVFRFFFNKTNELMMVLNRNSYSVYIIHTVVLGLLALILLPVAIPAFFKYLILTISTFILSNMIIYSYRKTIQKTMNAVSITTIVLVVLTLVFAFTGKPEANETENIETVKTEVPQETSSIHAAIVAGSLEAVKKHIKNGTNLNEKEPSGGSSPLITAIVFDKTEIALELIKAGANVNFQNNDGSTPLHTAAFFCRTEIVKALLKNGADKSIKNNAGSTARETVIVPFEAVQGIYEYFSKVYAPLGLKLDFEKIKTTRPEIAELLE